jgi:hypothetical protein
MDEVSPGRQSPRNVTPHAIFRPAGHRSRRVHLRMRESLIPRRKQTSTLKADSAPLDNFGQRAFQTWPTNNYVAVNDGLQR